MLCVAQRRRERYRRSSGALAGEPISEDGGCAHALSYALFNFASVIT